MMKEQTLKISKATVVILRKFVGKDSLEKKLQRLILRDEQ
ncbi:hypothetical protein AT54_01929 [Streptococcus equi subsp. zooepidemicus Sz12is]|uniref:Uncharacterized protein n=1 Tax=Streptococcus equi subsp. zooepidemicus Sz4is TaxID=1381082 RepID=A0AAW3GM40_STRSZ|nr:hypothetical protein AT54_01929 [Streptococcus equi subsp. zooepidemicus Sz12is]KIS17731.1 hypothetical protein AT55_01575 [Streptococcus equi subsp. zooepidemicus Sz4is]